MSDTTTMPIVALNEAQVEALREAVTALPRYEDDTNYSTDGVACTTMEVRADGAWLRRDDVLAILDRATIVRRRV